MEGVSVIYGLCANMCALIRSTTDGVVLAIVRRCGEE
jgi:hypothetical protein